MHRRRLLQYAGLSATLPSLPWWVKAATESSPSANRSGSLVLVELKGGNDGLNTVVPYADTEYYRLRPRLAVERDRVLALDERLGLNPALQPLLPAWRAGELAWVLGVGYAQPNRSHFRSIDIWETASDSDEVLDQGWIARSLPAARHTALPDVVILGGDDGPFRNGAQWAVSLQRPERFARQAARLEAVERPSDMPEALAHILAVRQTVRRTGDQFKHHLDGLAEPPVEFPTTPLGRQLQQVARMLLAGMAIPVFKVRIGSFDTHYNQRTRHDRLLTQLAEALAVFRRVLHDADLWDRVLVMSYSEFGRRAAENASQGTDHGTAAPHFVLGGRVRGGLHGEQPGLSALERGDLRHAVDYRQLYTTVARHWWGNESVEWQQRFPALGLL